MPRTIQDILDHADEVAARLEAYDPSSADERPAEEFLLEQAVLERARGERELTEAVAAARIKGLTWRRIGEILGTSPQAAHQRYGKVAESV